MEAAAAKIRGYGAELDAFAALIQACPRILLLAHVNPDGDALGSLLALGEGLEQLGRDVVMYCRGGAPSSFAFLPGSDRIASDVGRWEDYNLVVLVDHHEIERSGAEGFPEEAGPTVAVIDHHLSQGPRPEHALLDTTVSAAGELVYYLLDRLGVRITRGMAVNLFVALSTDTGSFSYSNTSAECLEVAAMMVRAGAEPWDAFRHIHLEHPRGRIELLGLALKNLEFYADGRIGLMTITNEMMADTGTTAIDTDGFVEYPRSVQGVELAVLLRELTPTSCKVSLRSLGRFNVAALARMFGGGGHAQAAGFSSDQPFETVKSNLVERAIGFLDRPDGDVYVP